MTTTFRAAVVRTPSGPESIELIDLPVVEPGAGQVRVAVAAAGVNPVDLGVAEGWFHQAGLVTQTERTGLGWDFAGTVVALGPDVDPTLGLAVGTRVAGLVGGLDRDHGAYAEQLVIDATAVAVVPDDLDLVTAATVPLNSLTAAQAADLLGDGDGRDLLVVGAAGAVGGYLLTLAGQRGWRVTGLARAQDEDYVRSLGAGFTTELTAGWDAVADPAVLQEQAVALVSEGGRYVGFRPGWAPADRADVRVTSADVVPDGARLRTLLEATARGELPARVEAVLPLERAAEAHRAVAKGGVRGRFVLQP
ncbi:zinc-binding dehydrogenase [Nocardioides sp. C4-1]|uniref:zinc-binding dehydrogenase n=1 Tax=Nocardioides sp. C4-1 TaxID=3151851 RepID=UPI003263EB5F